LSADDMRNMEFATERPIVPFTADEIKNYAQYVNFLVRLHATKKITMPGDITVDLTTDFCKTLNLGGLPNPLM